MKIKIIVTVFLISLLVSCSSDNNTTTNQVPIKNIKYLALGDSYTIGQSVCETCRFPIQLQDSIKKKDITISTFSTKIIATTGWTTTNLISAINSQVLLNEYDLVTLLIGVNNQYQNRSFSIYEEEFPALVQRAVTLAKGDKSNLIVVSIPDYSYTPYGNGSATISSGIDKYNMYAENYCLKNNIAYINITDITRQGLTNPALVATDGLHPSELAYSKFVERISPTALSVLEH